MLVPYAYRYPHRVTHSVLSHHCYARLPTVFSGFAIRTKNNNKQSCPLELHAYMHTHTFTVTLPVFSVAAFYLGHCYNLHRVSRRRRRRSSCPSQVEVKATLSVSGRRSHCPSQVKATLMRTRIGIAVAFSLRRLCQFEWCDDTRPTMTVRYGVCVSVCAAFCDFQMQFM